MAKLIDIQDYERVIFDTKETQKKFTENFLGGVYHICMVTWNSSCMKIEYMENDKRDYSIFTLSLWDDYYEEHKLGV